MRPVRKAVFPVAGLGTRFLPATKAMPKEMLPVIDKPLIQYAVEEAVAAGITDLIFVTGRNKRAIEDHFDNNQDDQTQIRSERELEFALNEHELVELQAIEDALKRIQEGVYGLCLSCGVNIPHERLRLEMYKKLAAVADEAQLAEIEAELAKVYARWTELEG